MGPIKHKPRHRSVKTFTHLHLHELIVLVHVHEFTFLFWLTGRHTTDIGECVECIEKSAPRPDIRVLNERENSKIIANKQKVSCWHDITELQILIRK